MVEVTRFDRLGQRLKTLSPEERVAELLLAEDASARVREMAPFGLYSLIREAGVNESSELIRLASAEQCQSFIDFDCWDGDSLDFEKLEAWIALIFQGPQEQMVELSDGLDAELIGLLLNEHVEIYAVEDEGDEAILDTIVDPVEYSPDGTFALVMPSNEETAALIRVMIFRLYTADQDLARQTLNAARYELRAEMEHTAHRIRCGRLEQHGFLPREEAVAIYSYINPAGEKERVAKIGDNGETIAGAPVLGPVDLAPSVEITLHQWTSGSDSYFGRLLRLACDRADSLEVTDQLLLQFSSLVNRSLMADFGEPGDVSAQGASLRRTHGILNIGLEYLSDRDDATALRILEGWPLKRIFRTGSSLVASIAKQARRILNRGNVILSEEPRLTLCSDSEMELIDGLLKPRSLRTSTYEEQFDDLEQIERAAATLALLAYKEVWTFGLRGHSTEELVKLLISDGQVATELDSITFDTLLATHSVLEIIDKGSPFHALRPSDLQTVVKGHIGSDELSDNLAEIISEVAWPPRAKEGSPSRNLGERWAADVSARLVEEYGRLDPSAFQSVRFLPPLILVRQSDD